MSPPVVFKDLLRRLLPDPRFPHRRARFRLQRELANALQLEESTVSRIMRSDDVFELEGCLRLALIGSYPVRLVLTLAHRDEVADVLDHLTGPATLTPEQRDLLQAWSQLSSETRAVGLEAMQVYLSRIAEKSQRQRRK